MGGNGTKNLENGYFLRFQGAKCRVVSVFEGRNFETFLCLSGLWAIDVKSGCAFRLTALRKTAGHSVYSKRIMPTTMATAWMSDKGSSNGLYASLSDTIRTWSLSDPGLIRLMSGP